ncbi:MAG: hypothetical protein ACRDTK_14275, partial [Mycobacterium sp.]
LHLGAAQQASAATGHRHADDDTDHNHPDDDHDAERDAANHDQSAAVRVAAAVRSPAPDDVRAGAESDAHHAAPEIAWPAF